MKSVLAVVFGLFLASEGLAQDKVSVEVRFKKGGKVTLSKNKSSVGAINIVMGEQKNVVNVSEKNHDVEVDEIFMVNEAGRPTRLRRSVTTKRTVETGGRNPEGEETTSPLEGKSFVLILKDGKTNYEEIPEGLSEGDLKKEKILRPVFERFLPKGEISVGDTWTIPEEDLLKDFNQSQGEGGGLRMKSGKAVGTLTSLEDGSVGVIVYKLKMKGADSDGLEGVMEMTISARVDSRQSRLLSVEGKGTMSISGTMDRGGNAMKLDGMFNLKMKETYSYE